MIQIQAWQVDFHPDKLDLGLLVQRTSWRGFLRYTLLLLSWVECQPPACRGLVQWGAGTLCMRKGEGWVGWGEGCQGHGPVHSLGPRNRMTDRHDWKHYHPAASLLGGNYVWRSVTEWLTNRLKKIHLISVGSDNVSSRPAYRYKGILWQEVLYPKIQAMLVFLTKSRLTHFHTFWH